MKLGLLSAIVASISLAPAATVNDYDRYLPLVRDGGGWRTSIVLANPGTEPSEILVQFLLPKMFTVDWQLNPQAKGALTGPQTVFASIPPKGTLVIDTSGAAVEMKQGFAMVVVFNGPRVGAYARLVHQPDGAAEETIVVPLLSEHEKRSILPVAFGGNARTEVIFVSENATTLVDFIFCDAAGVEVLSDSLQFGEEGQVVWKLEERYPQLKDFNGTLEWSANFPGAGYYDDLTFTGIALTAQGVATPAVVTAMTLPADQGKRSQYR